MNQNEFLAIVRTALELDDDRALVMEADKDTLPEWDSLGTLAVLSALDEATAGKVFSVKGVSKAKSLGELYQMVTTNL